MRFHAATWSAFHMPVQPGLIRPSGETQVISVKTRPGAADRALAVMDEVEVVGDAVDRRIHRHRRDGDAVLDLHLAQLERREHRRRGLVRAAVGRAFPEPALDRFQPFAVAQAQILVADALAAGEQRISELQRLEMEVAVQRLEPFGRVARAVLELEHFEAALRLIFVERGFRDSPSALEAPSLHAVEHLGQLDRVFERELGAAADREMRGVRGVAEQDDVAAGSSART